MSANELMRCACAAIFVILSGGAVAEDAPYLGDTGVPNSSEQRHTTDDVWIFYDARVRRDEGFIREATKRIMENNGDIAWLYTLRGLGFQMAGRQDEAIADFTKSLELDRISPTAFFGRANSFDVLKRLDEAQKDLESAVSVVVGKERIRALAFRMQRYFSQKMYGAALKDINGLIAATGDLKWYGARGTIHYHLKQYKKAADDFDKAIQANPKSSSVYNGRGAAKFAMGDDERAMSDLNLAIKFDPACAACYSNRSAVHQKLGNTNQSTADREKSVELRRLTAR